MARIELKDQTEIRKSIEHEGGYCRKWASGWQVGQPDLICVHQGTAFFMEVKSLVIKPDDQIKKWHTELEVTKKQRKELKEIREAGGFACIGGVLHGPGPQDKHLLLYPWNAPQWNYYTSVTSWKRPHYEMETLLAHFTEQGGWYEQQEGIPNGRYPFE